MAINIEWNKFDFNRIYQIDSKYRLCTHKFMDNIYEHVVARLISGVLVCDGGRSTTTVGNEVRPRTFVNHFLRSSSRRRFIETLVEHRQYVIEV